LEGFGRHRSAHSSAQRATPLHTQQQASKSIAYSLSAGVTSGAVVSTAAAAATARVIFIMVESSEQKQ
jgi:hypothetical protein